MTVVLDGERLTVDRLVRIARHNEPVELHPEALARSEVCRAMLEEKIVADLVRRHIGSGRSGSRYD